MSIHLDGFQPIAAPGGVTFSADVNGKKHSCLVSMEAISILANSEGHDVKNPVAVFKKHWLRIRDTAYDKIQLSTFDSSRMLVLTGADFSQADHMFRSGEQGRDAH